MTTTILALDLGTTTGWALRGSDGHITSGSESFRPQRFEGGGMRFLRFKRWLTESSSPATASTALHFEEVRRHVSTDAAHAYGGFLATLTAWCEHHQIPYQGVPVGTIKKHATGKGNAGKDDVIASVPHVATPRSTTTKPMRWRCCTGPSQHALDGRCEMKIPTPQYRCPSVGCSLRPRIWTRSSNAAGATSTSWSCRPTTNVSTGWSANWYARSASASTGGGRRHG
jgi:hypothetical protein